MSMAQRAENIAVEDRFHLLIDGELASSSESIDVINPAEARVFARCPSAAREQLDVAIEAARRAQPAWSARSFADRAALIEAWTSIVREHQQALAELLTMEQGKPLFESVAEVERSCDQANALTQIAIEPETLVASDRGRIELHYRPLGVVGIITPWNAPVALALLAMASALYTGNTVVVKPSPYTPLTTLRLGELAKDIFPAGVVNIIAGGDELGSALTESESIDKISFTGSVETGKKVMASAAGTLKRITLELGGNDPAIVLPDADPSAIAKRMFYACFVNTGQVCMAIKRIYVHESIYESLCDALVGEARLATIGNGLDSETTIGPLQNEMQYRKVIEIFEDTRRAGARFLVGGEIPDRPGYFLPPTFVTDISEDSRLVREEQFGPIVPILPYADLEDAIRRANDTRYGLSGSVWTSDPERGREVAMRLEVGTAWVNQHRVSSARVPFGGAKESGFGRQYSILGLKGYMEPQVISVAAS
jgi:acyl-CoA reductase-like NAD-dependent aldehyde dehydrogenase